MTYFKSGSWNCICAVCGKQVKSDEILKRWDGLLVCKSDWESRHILDFFRPTSENISVPFVSPEPEDTFVFVCYLEASQGIADTGEADCARAEISFPELEF